MAEPTELPRFVLNEQSEGWYIRDTASGARVPRERLLGGPFITYKPLAEEMASTLNSMAVELDARDERVLDLEAQLRVLTGDGQDPSVDFANVNEAYRLEREENERLHQRVLDLEAEVERLSAPRYFAHYKDDGPSGPCGQDAATTMPRDRLYVFDTPKDWLDFQHDVKAETFRRNARVVGAWAEGDDHYPQIDRVERVRRSLEGGTTHDG